MTQPRETPIPEVEAAVGRPGQSEQQAKPEGREDRLEARVEALEGQVRELKGALALILEHNAQAISKSTRQKDLSVRSAKLALELDWEMEPQFEMPQFLQQFTTRLQTVAASRDIRPLSGFDLRTAMNGIKTEFGLEEESEVEVTALEFSRVIEEKILAPLARALINDYLQRIVRVGDNEQPPRSGYEHVFPLLNRALEILNTQGGDASLYVLPQLGEQFDEKTMEKIPGLGQVRIVRTDAIKNQPYVFLPVKFGLRDRISSEVMQKAGVIVY